MPQCTNYLQGKTALPSFTIHQSSCPDSKLKTADSKPTKAISTKNTLHHLPPPKRPLLKHGDAERVQGELCHRRAADPKKMWTEVAALTWASHTPNASKRTVSHPKKPALCKTRSVIIKWCSKMNWKTQEFGWLPIATSSLVWSSNGIWSIKANNITKRLLLTKQFRMERWKHKNAQMLKLSSNLFRNIAGPPILACPVLMTSKTLSAQICQTTEILTDQSVMQTLSPSLNLLAKTLDISCCWDKPIGIFSNKKMLMLKPFLNRIRKWELLSWLDAAKQITI